MQSDDDDNGRQTSFGKEFHAAQSRLGDVEADDGKDSDAEDDEQADDQQGADDG